MIHLRTLTATLLLALLLAACGTTAAGGGGGAAGGAQADEASARTAFLSAVGDAFAADAKTTTVGVDAIPADYLGVDNGPVTTELIQSKLAACKTVIWNGP